MNIIDVIKQLNDEEVKLVEDGLLNLFATGKLAAKDISLSAYHEWDVYMLPNRVMFNYKGKDQFMIIRRTTIGNDDKGNMVIMHESGRVKLV